MGDGLIHQIKAAVDAVNLFAQTVHLRLKMGNGFGVAPLIPPDNRNAARQFIQPLTMFALRLPDRRDVTTHHA